MLRKFYIWSSTKLKTLLRPAEAAKHLEHIRKQISYSEPPPAPQSSLPPSLISAALKSWERGDPPALTNIHVEALHDHPDRAHLALILGSAHQQVGNRNIARSFIQAARDWGYDKKKIAHVLVADTYQTLGRAATLTRTRRDAPRVTVAQESGIVESEQSPGASSEPSDTAAATYQLTSEAVAHIGERLDKVLATMESQSEKIDALSLETKQQMKSASLQVDALMRIQTYLASGTLLPSFHGWPVSPDLACLLIQKIEQKRYDLVIEFGSGTSTVLIATIIDRLTDQTRSTYQIAFEHLKKYYENTENALAACRTKRHRADLVLAPLVNMMEDKQYDKSYKFYDCHDQITKLAKQQSVSHGKLLVIIDGPPGATGPHARFPGLPVVLAAFPHAEIDFLLDDTKRKDEKEILSMWRAILDQAKRPYQLTAYDFEKGATILEVQAG